MKGKKIKEKRSQIKEHIRELHLSATFKRGLFGPASTKETSNKPAENRDRRLSSSCAVLLSEGQKIFVKHH